MYKQRILWLCAFCMFATLGWGRDVADSQKLIIGSWYCASSDMFHRFDFGRDGGFMWSSYIPLKGNLRFWSPNYVGPATYAFRSPMNVQISSGAGSSEMVIRSLSKDDLSLEWFDTAYKCTHSSPPGDTTESRAAAAAELQKQKQRFIGKWKAANGKEYVEFLSNDICIHGILQNGHWVTTHDQSNVAHEGADASCGGNGTYSYRGPNVIVLDYGMGGDVTKYYRNPQSAH